MTNIVEFDCYTNSYDIISTLHIGAISQFMIKLYNITEIVAQQTLEQIVTDKVIEGHDISGYCFCPRCWTDVLSLALNNLTPRYVGSEEGEVFARIDLSLDYQLRADVYAQLTRALLQVGANPRHDRNHPADFIEQY